MQHQTLNLAGKQMEFAVSNFGTKEDTVRVASSSSKFKKTFFLEKDSNLEVGLKRSERGPRGRGSEI